MIPIDEPAVVLDDAFADRCEVHVRPGAIVAANEPGEVPAAFARLQAARDAGAWLAGYFSYELAYALEPRLAPRMPSDRRVPLLWFGVFDSPPSRPRGSEFWRDRGRAWAGPLELAWTEAEYAARFERVAEHIRAGDLYQANLALRARCRVLGPGAALFAQLRETSGARHGAYVHDGTRELLSLSPELFFRADADRTIEVAPMKGTVARGATPEEDAAAAAWLASSAKNRAENVMIVDVIRNDLGRLCESGTVHVPALCRIDTYPTVLQMVSTVRGRLRPGVDVATLARALFPCASITGAPKIRAIEVLSELESGPRGAYCGAVGAFAPDGSASFNVAIRTLTLRDGEGELGLGGGVVADSEPAREYAECRLKARFYDAARRPVAPFETLRATGGRVVRRERHVARLAAAARAFRIPYAPAEVEAALDRAASAGEARIRVQITEAGAVTVATSPPEPDAERWTYALATRTLDSRDVLLAHKTDWREFYDQERATSGCDEVLFLNERGELCEGSRSSVFLEIDGELLTPASHSGLLPGCLRAELLASGRCREAVLTRADLDRASAVWFGNSLRGLVRAEPPRAPAAPAVTRSGRDPARTA
jgi:para-aminobenzoate synthetase/4-amino-4-deoxychorismate lyase